MTNSLHLPAMPASYLESWHRIIWPKVLKKYGSDNLKGSILDKKVTSTNPELERIRLYGAAWSWIALPQWAKDAYWS